MAVTYTFSPSTTASSSQVNQNFTDCFSAIATAVPTGVIMMWSGSVASIPSGYYLCNGANGTPDLRDRFVVAAGSAYNPGDTGGHDSVDLTHAHNRIGGSTGWTSGGSPMDNQLGVIDIRPKFYALAYIMKS